MAKLLFFAGGVVLLVLLIRETDTVELWRRIREAGWMFTLAFGAHVGFMAMGALAWQTLLCTKEPVAFAPVFAAFWSGESLNYLLPAGAPGEIAKGIFLKERVEPAELVESLTIYNLLSGVSIFLWVLMGSVAGLVALDIPSGVPVLSAAAAALMLALMVGIRMALKADKLGRWLAWGNKIPFVRYDAEAVQERIQSMDERLRAYRHEERKRFTRTIAILLIERAFTVLEVYFLLLGLMPDRSADWLLWLSWMVLAAGEVVMYLTVFVPGQIGALEAGMTAIFGLSALPVTVGLALELLRRGRKILSILLMGVFWTIAQASPRRSRA
ncbi:MAG: lysylphosphatidylglycerol synthase transmembrane domain-containing protein [Myxococcota bacterium]